MSPSQGYVETTAYALRGRQVRRLALGGSATRARGEAALHIRTVHIRELAEHVPPLRIRRDANAEQCLMHSFVPQGSWYTLQIPESPEPEAHTHHITVTGRMSIVSKAGGTLPGNHELGTESHFTL